MFLLNQKTKKNKIILFLILCYFASINILYVKGNDRIISKKLYLIKNPENGVQRIVDENGKTILKTESGLADSDYIDEYYRQEKLKISECNGYNILFNETAHKTKMYDEDGYFISDGIQSLATMKYENGKLTYRKNEFGNKYQIYEYDINTKENKFIKEVGPNDLAFMSSDINNINEGDEKKANIINTNDKNKLSIGPGKENSKDLNDENFRIQKVADDSFVFESKKYGIKIENIKSYKKYDGTYNNLDVYELKTNYGMSYVNKDGKLILESYKEDENKSKVIFWKRFSFIDDKYIVVRCSSDGNDDKENLYIYEYDNSPTKLKEETTEPWSDDINKEVIFVIFGKLVKEVEDINSYNISTIDNKTILRIFRKENIVLSFDNGVTENNDILINYDFMMIKNYNKINLYNKNGDLIKDDIDTFALIELKNEGFYKSLNDSIVIMNNGKFEVVKQDGTVYLSGLDDNVINRSRKAYYNLNDEERFVLAKVGGKINYYDEEGKLVYEGIDDYNSFVRHGNYFVLTKNGKRNLYSKNGKALFNDLELDDNEKILEIYDNYSHYIDDYGRNSKMWFKRCNSEKLRFNDINGDIVTELNGKYNLYDIDGNILVSDCKYLEKYDEKYLIYEKGFEYGIMDRKGNKKFKFSIFDGTNYDE